MAKWEKRGRLCKVNEFRILWLYVTRNSLVLAPYSALKIELRGAVQCGVVLYYDGV